MKKIVLAASVVLAFGGGFAFAENPHEGEPDDLYATGRSQTAPQHVIAHPAPTEAATPDKARSPATQPHAYEDGSAHRFGDASPSSYSH